MFLFAPRGRLPPKTDEDRVALYNSLNAYTGLVRVDEPNKAIITISLAENPAWSGEAVRFFELSGERLTIRTEETILPEFPGRRLTGVVIFARESGPFN